MSMTKPKIKTSTAPSSPSDPPADPLEPSAIDRLRTYGGPVALAAGSVVTIAGMALHVAGDGSEPDQAFVRTVEGQLPQWMASHFLLAFGMALIAGGALTVWRLARGRGATLTALGAGLMSVGAALMALGDFAHGSVAYVLAGRVDPATSLAAQEAYFSHPTIGGVSMGGMFLPLGVLLLGIGLLRSRAVPRWAAIVLTISPIAVTLGSASGPRMVVFGLPFIVGLTALAGHVARRGADRFSRIS